MSFITEVIDRLVAQNVGVYGTNIFTSSSAILPPGDGPYLSVIDSGGTDSAKTQNNTATERPSAQIVARAKRSGVAYAMAWAAYNALGGANGLHNITLSGTWYIRLVPRQNITDIGLDDPGRAMMVFNIEAEKQPS